MFGAHFLLGFAFCTRAAERSLGEGLAEPTDFVKELHASDETEVRKIMRGNALELLGTDDLTPASSRDTKRAAGSGTARLRWC